MAKAYGMEADKLKEYMGDAEKESMKRDLAIQKAVDLDHGKCQRARKELRARKEKKKQKPLKKSEEAKKRIRRPVQRSDWRKDQRL